jgi:alkylation response protein AidB-like acyl-CoA dehydrogenase
VTVAEPATVLERARSSVERLAELVSANEDQRQLGDETVHLLADAGVFGMTMSERLGGSPLTPIEQVTVIEELSAADGAAGWCAMINSDGGYVSAYLDEMTARTMYPTLAEPTCLVANPLSGRATEADGGFRVAGRWGFASGSSHAEWFALACLVFTGEIMNMNGDLPEIRMVVVPRSSVQILDDWDGVGLAGSASASVVVDDIVVPAERTYSLLAGEPVDPAPLYRHRFMFFSNMAGVPLGVARSAISYTTGLVAEKVPFGSFTPASQDPQVAESVARATALYRSSRAYYHDALGHLWDHLLSGSVPQGVWVDVRLAMTNAFHSCREAVQLCFEAAGSSALPAPGPLSRCLRDATAMTAHVVAQRKSYLGAGRHLFGLEPGMPGF